MRPRYEYQFCRAEGPGIRFDQIKNVCPTLIGADLDSDQPIIYGQDPGQFIPAGLLASITLPPRAVPVEKEDHLIVDGDIFSNLPIEPALTMRATEIIALDISKF